MSDIIKQISIATDAVGSYDTRDIGADALNVTVGYNAAGEIITDSTTPTTTKNVAEVIKEVKEESAVPKSHASTTTEFGAGSATEYGHVKISDDLSGDSVTALSSAGAKALFAGTAASLSFDEESSILSLLNGNKEKLGDGVEINGMKVEFVTQEEYDNNKATYDAMKALIVITDSGDLSAVSASYSNTASGLTAKNVQAAIDELADSAASSLLTLTADDDLLVDKVVTCTNGVETLTATFTSSLSINFKLKYADTYTITCEGYSVTVDASSFGAIYNSTLHIPKSVITITTTTEDLYNKDVVLTLNDTVIETATFNPNTVTFKVYSAGTYVATCGEYSTTVDVALDTDYDASINALKIVSFANGTDEEISKMLTAYYNDEISWEDMGWAVGDTRLISLSAMTAPNPNSSTTWEAQNITVVIVDHDHTDLATPINGHTKSCITVQTRECLNNLTSTYDTTGHICVNGDSTYDTTFTKWSNLYMRTYLNSTVLGAFSSDFKSMIKPSSHYRHTNYNTADSELVTDTLFLPSYPELFGTTSYSYYTVTSPAEGTQFAYYTTSANRIKYGNNNGEANGTKTWWWQGSANSYYTSSDGYHWCGVLPGGSAGDYRGDRASGLAPAFAM